MNLEQTIDATLDASGQLVLAQQPQLPPGPVQVTIRVVTASRARRGLADVVREIAAAQSARGFSGRSAEELRAEEDERAADEAARDHELNAARNGSSANP